VFNKRYLIVNICTCLFFLTVTTPLFGGTEFVTLIKIFENNDIGIIKRSNGELWKIEKGIGALSFWRFEGKEILIHSPGLFCGIGSKVILPDANQEAKIWNAELVESGSPAELPENSDTAAEESTAIEAQIDGEFKGFEGQTIFKLTNGQIWQQSEYYYYYHYSYSPKVVILKSGPLYKFLVEGVPKPIGAVRIK